MENKLLKYCLIIFSLVITVQSITAGTLREKINNESTVRNTVFFINAEDTDLDNFLPVNPAIFLPATLNKQFYNHALYSFEGAIENPKSRLLICWVKVKLQV